MKQLLLECGSLSYDGSNRAIIIMLKQRQYTYHTYGRYFNMSTCVLRGGCLTGPNHSGVELHGFLSYLIKANITGLEYTIYGYKGKQVRDNIHSYDLVNMFWHFYQNPKKGEVYNAGGGRFGI